MHCITASLPPEMVTALSVLFGNISLATCTLAPVTSRISLILLPPFPIRLPHWLAGTTSLKVMGGRGTVPGEIRLLRSWHQQVWQSRQLRPVQTHLVKFVADQCKCLENCFSISSDGDDSLWTASITNVNFGSALQVINIQFVCNDLKNFRYLLSKSFHDVSFLSNNTSNFLKIFVSNYSNLRNFVY